MPPVRRSYAFGAAARTSGAVARSAIGERHQMACTNVHVDDPRTAVTNAPSASFPRLRHREATAGDVGSHSQQMERSWSTTDRLVVDRTPVPRHDGQRPISATRAEPLEDCDELAVRPLDLSAVMAPELSP